MLYIAEIYMPQKDFSKWGEVIRKTIVLPDKVRKINGYMIQAEDWYKGEKDNHRYSEDFRCHEFTDSNENKQLGAVLYPQIGSVSVSINEATPIIQDSPLVSYSKIQGTIAKDMKKFETPIPVKVGSYINIILEENNESAICSNTLNEYGHVYDNGQGGFVTYYNGYILKLILDYDK